MASIGPQLPPELARKRKHNGEDGDRSPKNARTNEDEIALDEDASESESEAVGPKTMGPKTIGPSLPETTIGPSPKTTAIGPSLPKSTTTIGPSLPKTSTTQVGPIGPSLPDARPTVPIGPSMPETTRHVGPRPEPTKHAAAPIGPARPIGPSISTRPDDSDSDSDSDSDYGPALPSLSSSSSSRPAPQPMAAPDEPSEAPQRDSWMLAPPTASSNRAPDPTKLRARKFATGRAAAAASGGGATSEVDSIWTETVEQKRKRLEDAVLGRGTATTTTTPAAAPAPKPTAAEAARVEEYNARTRGQSLYDQHQTRRQESGKKDDEDDPSKRAFDKDKDMALGGRINTTQRRDLLNRASDFDSRFAKGSFL